MKKCILAIAGSDSIAGAGIQIDVKVAASLGVHATCAITAITAQNTMGVACVQQMEPEMVRAQIDAVFADVPPQAVKIGMLGSTDVALAVADALRGHPEVPVVLDPVLVATSGAVLAEDSLVNTLKKSLFPLAVLITPNLPEAEALSGIATMREAAARLLSYGVQSVLIKGGHGKADAGEAENGGLCIDRLYAISGSGRSDAPCTERLKAEQALAPPEVELLLELRSQRVPGEFHGTGCSLSTAIACGLAKGLALPEAVKVAHNKVASMIVSPTAMGHGSSIIDPFPPLAS